MSLAKLYSEYIFRPAKERDQQRLYITDIGKCMRSVAYRCLGTEKDYMAQSAIYSQSIMFDVAEYIESTIAKALSLSGQLVFYQADVSIPRDNWGGRIDILADYDTTRIIEVKTLRSNAMSKPLPYDNHKLQVSTYHGLMLDEWKIMDVPILAYFDRGGSNPPVEVEVSDVMEVWVAAQALMDELDDMRNNLPTLPPQREKVVKVRSYGKELKIEPHHDCSYCDYKSVCRPDLTCSVLAKRKSKEEAWTCTRNANKEKLLDYIEAETKGIHIEEE